jgi:CubicO group peptidase (beta-lactamase class C family)
MAPVLRPFGSLAIVLALCSVTPLVMAKSALIDQEQLDRIGRVETGLPAVTQGERTVHLSLGQWMQALAVPGVSIAVIDDYRVVWTKAYGVSTSGPQGLPITPETIFQAASIAKPVTALAVLRQVEIGRMDLEEDINSYLRSWRLPEDDVQAGEKVTLRRLLAHTGGITPGGFAGYDRTGPAPAIADVLRGIAPARNAPTRVVSKPGTEVAYSGLGYTLLQVALEDRLQQPFEAILQETVLQPLGMHDSTFEQQLPAALGARAASGHLGVGATVEGGWRAHPELAAAGLWSTPADLAMLIIDVAKSRRGDKGRLLSSDLARQMLSLQQDGMGLGFVVREDGAHGHFAHSGGNTGYFAHFEMLADTGQGVVIMTNSDAGQALAPLLIAGVANEYDWPLPDRRQLSDTRAERVFAQHDRVANQRIKIDLDPAVLSRYVGKYQLAPDLLFNITLVDGQLRVRLGDQPEFPLFAESPSKFFLEVVDAQITFVIDASGSPTGLILHQGGRDQQAASIE